VSVARPELAHHRRTPTPPSASTSEGGASLLIALLIVTVIVTTVTALFAFAGAGHNANVTYRGDSTLRFAGDGALEVAIQRVADNPRMGESTPLAPATSVPACSMDVPIDEVSPTRPDNHPTVFAGSFLSVACAATPGTTSGGTTGAVTDGDQRQQQPRDVTFTVTCNVPTGYVAGRTNPIKCLSGAGTPRVVARARVRFEVDPGATPPVSWAVVPKVISWTVYR
jgi:hypothetical protein